MTPEKVNYHNAGRWQYDPARKGSDKKPTYRQKIPCGKLMSMTIAAAALYNHCTTSTRLTTFTSTGVAQISYT